MPSLFVSAIVFSHHFHQSLLNTGDLEKNLILILDIVFFGCIFMNGVPLWKHVCKHSAGCGVELLILSHFPACVPNMTSLNPQSTQGFSVGQRLRLPALSVCHKPTTTNSLQSPVPTESPDELFLHHSVNTVPNQGLVDQ